MIVFLLLVSLSVLVVFVRLAPTCHLVFAGVISDLPEGQKISRKVPQPRLFVTPDGKRFSRKDRFTGLAHGHSMVSYGIPDGAEFYGSILGKDLGSADRIKMLGSLKNPIVVIEPAPTAEFPSTRNQTAKRLRCISSVDADGTIGFHPYFDGREHKRRNVSDVICVVDGVAH